MFLILAAVVVVCGHVYGGNSSDIDVYSDDAVFLNNITELGNKSYTLQPLTHAPAEGLEAAQFKDTLSALLVEMPLQDKDNYRCHLVSKELRDILYRQWNQDGQRDHQSTVPRFHYPQAVSLMAYNEQNEDKYEVFVSESWDDVENEDEIPRHAEDVLLDELDEGSFRFPTTQNWFYVSSTPCYKCTSKIIDYFSGESLPAIYVSRLFNPRDSRNINAVMRLLVRGYKIYSTSVKYHLDLVDAICHNKEAVIPWRMQVCRDAKKFIKSGVGKTRYQFTKGVLELLRQEAKWYINRYHYHITDNENTEYVKEGLYNKIVKKIKEYKKTTCKSQNQY